MKGGVNPHARQNATQNIRQKLAHFFAIMNLERPVYDLKRWPSLCVGAKGSPRRKERPNWYYCPTCSVSPKT